MSTDLAELRDSPYLALAELEADVRAARVDVVAGQASVWVGLGFRLRDVWCVTPREDVREVITLPRLTRVPAARPWLTGVANVRGNLLPVTDLGELLGMPRITTARPNRVLVLNSDRIPAGFLVDEVVGYRQFVPSDQRHELTASAPELAPYVLGGFSRDNRSWLVVSLRRLAGSPIFTSAG
jgi:twitching motility protein PilI